MSIYKKAENDLKNKYDIDLINDLILARFDRAIYYVEFLKNEIKFNKIHGKSSFDLVNDGTSFNLSYIDENFYNYSKYGEVAGQDYYKQKNLNTIKDMLTEANITIPIVINNQKFWFRFHLYTIIANSLGKPVLASCYITDVTKYLVSEEALYEKTHKDELTGLFNRYTLHYHFDLYGGKPPIVGIYFDIDDFKKYNDNYGHDIGDSVLVKLSDNLKQISSKNFIPYRIGGDEFFILIFNADLNMINTYTSKVQDSIKQVKIPNINYELSISAGCVYSSSDIANRSEIFIKEADRLMYVSKNNGKAITTTGEFSAF